MSSASVPNGIIRTTGLHKFLGENKNIKTKKKNNFYPALVKQKNVMWTTISGATESFVMLANDRLN